MSESGPKNRGLSDSWKFIQCLFLLAGALYFGSNLLSPVRFDREKIEVWAFDRQTQVTGFYHYVNHSHFPASFSLGIPFPVDPEHPWPAEFHVSEVEGNGAFVRDIVTRSYHGETVFRLWFWPSQERWVRVDYIQGAHVPQARYILLSTRKWGEPLKHAEYALHFGEGLELVSSTYPMTPDGTSSFPSYSFSRSDFFPSEDWVFNWQTRTTPEASAKGNP